MRSLPAALSAPATPPPAQSDNALYVYALEAEHRPRETTAFFDDLKAGNAEVSVCRPVEFKMSLTPWRLRKRAPGLGQDTDAVIERLGFAPPEIADLKQLGVLDRKEKPNADRQDR